MYSNLTFANYGFNICLSIIWESRSDHDSWNAHQIRRMLIGEAAASLNSGILMIKTLVALCPLLGLLGTVLGMIKAFNAIVSAGAMGQPELLAGGIGQALITTAAGLSVAIPALIAYMFLTSRVDKLIIEIDALGQEIVQSIAADSVPRRRRAA